MAGSHGQTGVRITRAEVIGDDALNIALSNGANLGTVKNCVVLASMLYPEGHANLNIGRISGGGSTCTNNYAIEISGMTVGSENDKNGETITGDNATREHWWSNSTNGIWKDVWGADDGAPWQWDRVDNRPVLYWQLP